MGRRHGRVRPPDRGVRCPGHQGRSAGAAVRADGTRVPRLGDRRRMTPRCTKAGGLRGGPSASPRRLRHGGTSDLVGPWDDRRHGPQLRRRGRRPGRSSSRHLPPTPMWSYPAAGRGRGRDRVRQARERAAGRRVQGARRAHPARRDVVRRSASPRHGLATRPATTRSRWPTRARPTAPRARVVMPAAASPAKAAAAAALGARGGADTATTWRRRSGTPSTLRRVRPARGWSARATHRSCWPGSARVYLEILEAQPDLDAILVPIGSGTGAAAAPRWSPRELAPNCRVIGVQSRRVAGPRTTPGGPASWSSGRTAPASTAWPPGAATTCRSG